MSGSITGPTPEQQKIIDSDENTIVIANPGTGKTTTLSFKIINLLKQNVEPEDILCITYTEKAKKEMYDAIKKNSQGQIADSVITRININTFHSFAYQYLLESGDISGDIIGNNILRFSLLQSFERHGIFNYGKDYLISDIVPKVENAIRYIKNFGIVPDTIDIPKAKVHLEKIHSSSSKYSLDEVLTFLEKFVDVYRDYENSKDDTVDYTDMLLLFVKHYSGRKFPYVAVDEMQDMNGIEADIVKMLYETLFLVGDSKQAIFGFQGGSIKNFEEFKKICKPLILGENMRSTQEILDYSKNYFLENTKYPAQYKDELDNLNSRESGPQPEIIATEAPYVKILDLVNQNRGKKIGVITRKNYQIVELSKFLDFHNIKYVTTSSQSTTAKARDEIVKFLFGVLSDDNGAKISSLFTFFSPNSLKDAFEISEKYKNKESFTLPQIYSSKLEITKATLDEIFQKIIFPISISRGPEWLSTVQSVKNQIDEYFTLKNPTVEGLFDFIKIVEESYVDSNEESDVTLTSVHKSKGRTFDIVIYYPSKKKSASFVDEVTKSILLSNGIDIEDEIEEESLRIDFVAFTRAAKKLIILANDKTSKDFVVDKLSTLSVDPTDKKQQDITSFSDFKLADAYSLFVAGDMDAAKKLLNETDDWLVKYIHNYFANLEKLSYSAIKPKPYDFLKSRIMKVPSYSRTSSGGFGKEFGDAVHKAIQKILNNKAKITDFSGNEKIALENALAAIEQLSKQFSGLKLDSTERDFLKNKLPISAITNYSGDLILDGKIDAVFTHDDGVLIVDWKTDKDISSDYKQQVAFYKKVYSKLENVPEDKITICVVYLSLRDSISTGKLGTAIDFVKRGDPFDTFENHLKTILGWKDDPNKFIEELVNVTNVDEPLLDSIKSQLVPT
jgi:DNA helicase-2/ATP-dependent DNA helicase PcrA